MNVDVFTLCHIGIASRISSTFLLTPFFSGHHRKKALMEAEEVEVVAKHPKWLMWRPILIESKLSSGYVLIGLSLRNENVSLLRDR